MSTLQIIGVISCALVLLYVVYTAGKLSEVDWELLMESDPDVPDELTVDMDDARQMIELCILRARQLVACDQCGFSPLPCGLTSSSVDQRNGDNVGFLVGTCPQCDSINTGHFDQHHMAMIAATYEWDRSALNRDLLELESANQIFMTDNRED